jgi:hypothetical protein
VNAGVRYNNNSDKYYKNEYFKINGETDAAFNLSAKVLLPTSAEKAVSAGLDKYIARIEGLLSQKSGSQVAIPSATKASLKLIWPMGGLDIKGKAARMFMLSRDKQGNPTQLRIVTETQWVFSWRALSGADQNLASGRQNVAVGFVQGSIAGRKYNTQSILDLDGPEHAENLKQAKNFLTGMGLNALTHPINAVRDFTNSSPEAKKFSAYIDQNGQTYQQIWDSNVTTFVGFGKTISGGKYVRVLPVYEPETNKLVGAQYKTPQGWKPWTHCQR